MQTQLNEYLRYTTLEYGNHTSLKIKMGFDECNIQNDEYFRNFAVLIKIIQFLNPSTSLIHQDLSGALVVYSIIQSNPDKSFNKGLLPLENQLAGYNF